MASENPVIDLLKGCRFGVSISDKLIIFIYMFNALIILSFLYVILGKEKTSKRILSKPKMLNWIPFKKVNVDLNGILLSMPLVVDYLFYVKSDWELQEKEFMKKILKNDGIILDVGSNIGLHTITLAKENINSKVISVEASPTIFKILNENCSKNKLTNVIFYNKAITDLDDSEINFYHRESMSTTNKQLLDVWEIPDSDIKQETTKTVTIDTLLQREKVDNVLLLKMDIEGGEVVALDGAKLFLEQKKIQNMMIEYHSYSNRDYIEKLLKDLGYDVTLHKRPILYENNDLANGHIFAELSLTSS